MTVADRIKFKRCELGLSQADLAKRAKYSDKTRISKLENAGNEISMKQVKRIAEALNVSPAYLMGWEEDQVLHELVSAYSYGEFRQSITDEEIDMILKARKLIDQYGKEQFEKAWNLTTRLANLPAEQQTALLTLLGGSQTGV